MQRYDLLPDTVHDLVICVICLAQADLARYSCRFADGFLKVDVPGLAFGVSAITPVRSKQITK